MIADWILWTFAAIGFVVCCLTTFLLVGWLLTSWVTKHLLRRQAKAPTLTPQIEQDLP